MKWERESPYLFLEDLRMKWCKNRGLFESDTVSLRVFQVRKKMNSQKCSRENWKGLKNWPFLRKTHNFCDWIKSRISHQVQPPEHLKAKLLKNFLSVFRDWKFHLQESRKLSRKNLCVPLVTGPSTCDQVTNLNCEKHENPDFWKIF